MGGASSVAAAAAVRAFRPAGRPPLPGDAGEPLTVVTYNMLANKYAHGGMHSYCPPQFLDWQHCKQQLLQELVGFGADLLCLQELEASFFEEELQPVMAAAGYESLYQPRSPSGLPGRPVTAEGVALMFRTDRLECQASKAVRLGDCLEPGLRGSFFEAVRKRDDWLLCALLRDRATQRHLLAGCTHLFADPRFPDIKAAQAHLMCRAATLFLRQQQLLQGLSLQRIAATLPMLFCGDFNSLPAKRDSDAFDTVPPGQVLTSGAYQVLSTAAGIDSSHPDHPARRSHGGEGRHAAQLRALRLTRTPLALESAAVAAWGREPPLTTRTATFSGTLDYVWLSQPHWAVAAALELPYRFDAGPPHSCAVVWPADVRDLAPIPSQGFPSDHLALGFKLHMLPPVP